MKNKKKIIYFFLFVLFSTVVFSESINSLTGQASKDIVGKVIESEFGLSVCLNEPPAITNTTCPKKLNQDDKFECLFEGFDSDAGQKLNFSVFFGNSVDLFLLNSTSGAAKKENFSSFMPNNYTYVVYVFDDSGCSNNKNESNFTLEVLGGVNRAPFLKKNIENITWKQNEKIVPYNLNDYFIDLDEDQTTYNASNNENVIIDIDKSGLVMLTPKRDFVGTLFVYFYASDTHNAMTASNLVRLEVEGTIKTTEQVQEIVKKSTGTTYKINNLFIGTDLISCIPEWVCGDWQECKPNGLSKRDCFEKNKCSEEYFKPENLQICVYEGYIDLEEQKTKEDLQKKQESEGKKEYIKEPESEKPTTIFDNTTKVKLTDKTQKELLFILIIFVLGTVVFTIYFLKKTQTHKN